MIPSFGFDRPAIKTAVVVIQSQPTMKWELFYTDAVDSKLASEQCSGKILRHLRRGPDTRHFHRSLGCEERDLDDSNLSAVTENSMLNISHFASNRSPKKKQKSSEIRREPLPNKHLGWGCSAQLNQVPQQTGEIKEPLSRATTD
jgi:hypothetical protein